MKVRRKDVLDYFINSDSGWCDWCKHYQHLDICSYCYNNHRYSFDWKNYYKEHKDEIEKYLKCL